MRVEPSSSQLQSAVIWRWRARIALAKQKLLGFEKCRDSESQRAMAKCSRVFFHMRPMRQQALTAGKSVAFLW